MIAHANFIFGQMSKKVNCHLLKFDSSIVFIQFSRNYLESEKSISESVSSQVDLDHNKHGVVNSEILEFNLSRHAGKNLNKLDQI